jgi:hypothetical protein
MAMYSHFFDCLKLLTEYKNWLILEVGFCGN